MSYAGLIKVYDEVCAPSTSKCKTVADIARNGECFRHPDSTLIPYPLVVKEKVGHLPKGSNYNLAIVGAGAAGTVVLYELWRLVKDRPDVTMHVTIYESDELSFSWSVPAPKSSKSVARSTELGHKRAGRVFSALSLGESEVSSAQKKSCLEKRTVYEIGAMRFPEIAGLTWHYIGEVFKQTDNVKVFPNPGRVSTEFVFGDRVDRFQGNSWLSKLSPTRVIAGLVAEGLSGSEEGHDTSLFPIGTKDAAKVAKELRDENTKIHRLIEIQQDWKKFIDKYDSLSLGGAVREILMKKVNILPTVDGIVNEQDKINYYFELFGSFGFGTGGFKPMYSSSLVEMMRLFLWNYANEYTLPVEENSDFIRRIFEKATILNEEKNKNFTWKVEKAEVSDVCHSANETGDAVVYFSSPKPNSCVSKSIHDYVFLAVPPKQLSNMTSRMGPRNEARRVLFGNHAKQADVEICARPPLVLSRTYEAPNAKMLTAINQIHMTASSKVFGTIKADLFNKYAPVYNNEKIKAISSDSGLATSYVVPSPIIHDGQPQCTEGIEPEYYSFLLSYNWEDDTKRLISELISHPINFHDPNKPDDPKHTKMIDSIINHTNRDVKNPETGELERWWFHRLLTDDGKGKAIHDTVSFDWTTHTSAGGFKLDLPGGHYNSHLCFRYHTHAINKSLGNRFFLAGDSYSHLGGWLEGAFMSAVNAVCGFVVAANKGDVSRLTERAQPIITAFEPVAPICH